MFTVVANTAAIVCPITSAISPYLAENNRINTNNGFFINSILSVISVLFKIWSRTKFKEHAGENI